MWDCGAGAGRQRNRGSNLRRRPADRHPPLARFADRRALKRENEELQRALAEVHMSAKDVDYGMAPLWTFTFEKADGAWKVTKAEH